MTRSGKAKPQDDRGYVAAAARLYGLTPRMKKLAQLLFEGATRPQLGPRRRRRPKEGKSG